jgi:hypothetical protein
LLIQHAKCLAISGNFLWLGSGQTLSPLLACRKLWPKKSKIRRGFQAGEPILHGRVFFGRIWLPSTLARIAFLLLTWLNRPDMSGSLWRNWSSLMIDWLGDWRGRPVRPDPVIQSPPRTFWLVFWAKTQNLLRTCCPALEEMASQSLVKRNLNPSGFVVANRPGEHFLMYPMDLISSSGLVD